MIDVTAWSWSLAVSVAGWGCWPCSELWAPCAEPQACSALCTQGWPDHLLWAPSLSQHHPGSKFPLPNMFMWIARSSILSGNGNELVFILRTAVSFSRLDQTELCLDEKHTKHWRGFVCIPYAGLREQPVWCLTLRFSSRGCSLSLIFVQLGQMFLGTFPKEQWTCCLAQNRKLWKFWKILLSSS